MHFESEEVNILYANMLNGHQVKFIFQARTRMLNVKANYKNRNSNLICEELNANLISQQIPVYEDIFSENFDRLKLTANQLQEIKREVLNPASWKKRSK